MIPWPTQVFNPNGILIGSAVFARAQCCDEPTDHATPSLTTGHIYIHSTAVQPNNNALE